jgi:hypothetical protein
VARPVLYVAVVALLLLHQDTWLWDDSRLLLGLPVGLTYHVAYCGAAALLLWLLARFAWPRHLEDGDEDAS